MFGGLFSNAKFQCLGMSWGCYDNGLKERRRWKLHRGEREKFFFLFSVWLLRLLPKTVAG